MGKAATRVDHNNSRLRTCSNFGSPYVLTGVGYEALSAHLNVVADLHLHPDQGARTNEPESGTIDSIVESIRQHIRPVEIPLRSGDERALFDFLEFDHRCIEGNRSF